MFALVGGALGLVALGLYLHPFHLIAVLINVVIVVLVWGRCVSPGAMSRPDRPFTGSR